MKKNNKGFSLVELMIALAISGIVMTALVLLVVQSVNGYGKQTALAQIQSDVDVSLNQISKNYFLNHTLSMNHHYNNSGLFLKH